MAESRPPEAARPGRPDVEAPLVVWEYAFALERRCDALVAERDRAVKRDEWLVKQIDGCIETAEVLEGATELSLTRALLGDLRDARAALVEDSGRG